jgi:hypothetical protein
MSLSRRSIRSAVCGGAALLAAATTCSTAMAARAGAAATTAHQRSGAVAAPPRAFAYYYLWWSTQHWHDKLGSTYGAATHGFSTDPLPLPATLDANGCSPRSLYSGNELTDVAPQLWTQDDPAVLERDVRDAAAAGLTGFLVNWHGTGQAGQTPTSISYSKRLDALVQAVNKVRGQGVPFTLWLSYEAAATIRSTSQIVGDLTYLRDRYALNGAFDHSFTTRLPVVWTGSRKYGAGILATVAKQLRSSIYLIGDENWKTWTAQRAASLDASTYYWSSQDPYANPASFGQIRQLAAMVRASGANPDGSAKRWFAPFAPGYDSKLLGGSTCVPRNGLRTLQTLFDGNAASNPDGWVLISWNEIAESTYVVPLERYGRTYLDGLHTLLTS